MSNIQDHLRDILETYSEGEAYEEMKSAIENFAELTGKIDEDAEGFEARMNSFNDWFIFNYKKENGHRVVEDYIMGTDLSPEVVESLLGINHSLFLFSKVNYRKKMVLKDILHGTKVEITQENSYIALVEEDLFVGRVLQFEGENYLLNGVNTMPGSTLSILKKESKKIRKQKNKDEEEDFLLKLESLKTKSLHYGHVGVDKIFNFS